MPIITFMNRQRMDKEEFKQIFRDHWPAFRKRYPRYQSEEVEEVIEKMLGCGDPANGCATYLCFHCFEKKQVPFSCKSGFCLSCAKVYVDRWVSHISKALYENVSYLHIVLTIPDKLLIYFYRDRGLLGALMRCGSEMFADAASTLKGQRIEPGTVVVLHTSGRSGRWNPHLHILVTAGGLTADERWCAINYLPYSLLRRKWQYHLLNMLKARVNDSRIRILIDALWRRHPKGFVIHLKRGRVPAGGSGLAIYLAKYLVSPPIALRRIISYNGRTIRYWYKDHLTGKRKEEEISIFRFIGRMVQHILPKGCHRVRYYGLQATCKAKKVRDLLKRLLVGVGRAIKGAYRIVARKNYRERVLASTGRDPFRCPRCGQEMVLWKVWHPRYGTIYDELEQIKKGKYGSPEEVSRGRGRPIRGRERVVQLSMPFVRVEGGGRGHRSRRLPTSPG